MPNNKGFITLPTGTGTTSTPAAAPMRSFCNNDRRSSSMASPQDATANAKKRRRRQSNGGGGRASRQAARRSLPIRKRKYRHNVVQAELEAMQVEKEPVLVPEVPVESIAIKSPAPKRVRGKKNAGCNFDPNVMVHNSSAPNVPNYYIPNESPDSQRARSKKVAGPNVDPRIVFSDLDVTPGLPTSSAQTRGKPANDTSRTTTSRAVHKESSFRAQLEELQCTVRKVAAAETLARSKENRSDSGNKHAPRVNSRKANDSRLDTAPDQPTHVKPTATTNQSHSDLPLDVDNEPSLDEHHPSEARKVVAFGSTNDKSAMTRDGTRSLGTETGKDVAAITDMNRTQSTKSCSENGARTNQIDAEAARNTANTTQPHVAPKAVLTFPTVEKGTSKSRSSKSRNLASLVAGSYANPAVGLNRHYSGSRPDQNLASRVPSSRPRSARKKKTPAKEVIDLSMDDAPALDLTGTSPGFDLPSPVPFAEIFNDSSIPADDYQADPNLALELYDSPVRSPLPSPPAVPLSNRHEERNDIASRRPSPSPREANTESNRNESVSSSLNDYRAIETTFFAQNGGVVLKNADGVPLVRIESDTVNVATVFQQNNIQVTYLTTSKGGCTPKGLNTTATNRRTNAQEPDQAQMPWADEETHKIRLAMAAGKSWNEMAELLPGRRADTIKRYWDEELDPTTKNVPWSDQENAILFNAQARLGNRWTEIATFLPGRSEKAIKNQMLQFCAEVHIRRSKGKKVRNAKNN